MSSLSCQGFSKSLVENQDQVAPWPYVLSHLLSGWKKTVDKQRNAKKAIIVHKKSPSYSNSSSTVCSLCTDASSLQRLYTGYTVCRFKKLMSYGKDGSCKLVCGKLFSYDLQLRPFSSLYACWMHGLSVLWQKLASSRPIKLCILCICFIKIIWDCEFHVRCISCNPCNRSNLLWYKFLHIPLSWAICLYSSCSPQYQSLKWKLWGTTTPPSPLTCHLTRMTLL